MKTKSKSPTTGTKPTPVFDDAVISAALEKHLDLAWTAGNQRVVRREVGAENHARMEEILTFASNQDAWLNASSLSAAADAVSGKLSQHYPRLSPGAVFKIVNQATYGWR